MASEGLSADDVGALRVVDLKEELKTRGLATDGKKVCVCVFVGLGCCSDMYVVHHVSSCGWDRLRSTTVSH